MSSSKRRGDPTTSFREATGRRPRCQPRVGSIAAQKRSGCKKRWGDQVDHLLTATLGYAKAAVRSSHEVRAYLRRCGIPPSTATRLLAACRDRGLLDDQASASLWAEHWARQGYAWAAISLKLSVKGFDVQTIRSIGNTLARVSDDETRARAVVSQRVRGGVTDPRQRLRLARRLASRGFEPDVIQRVLGEPLASTLSE